MVLTTQVISADQTPIRGGVLQTPVSSRAPFWRLWSRDERGQDLVEYALLATIIALGLTAGMGSLATSLSSIFSAVANTLTSSI
jgi:Flp pilus assembly pilin Flp